MSFRPYLVGAHCGALVVRNNLTVVDVVLLRGAGGQGALKFGNRKPDTTAPPLTFSIAPKHLKDCEGQWNFTIYLLFCVLLLKYSDEKM